MIIQIYVNLKISKNVACNHCPIILFNSKSLFSLINKEKINGQTFKHNLTFKYTFDNVNDVGNVDSFTTLTVEPRDDSKCMERLIKNNLTGIQIPGISHGLLSFQAH